MRECIVCGKVFASRRHRRICGSVECRRARVKYFNDKARAKPPGREWHGNEKHARNEHLVSLISSGMPVRAAAVMFGISTQRVYQIMHGAIDRASSK